MPPPVDPATPPTTDLSSSGQAQAEATTPGAGASGFAAETLAELRKVVWPSRQQLFSESVVVILMVAASAATIAALDRFFGWAASQVFR